MAKKNPDSTATTVSAKGKSAVNGGVNTKRMRPMEVNERLGRAGGARRSVRDGELYPARWGCR